MSAVADLSAGGAPAMRSGEQLLPHVGRDGEIALLLRLATAPAGERPAAVTIEGAPGTGKTRLLREALTSTPPARQVVCTCRRLQQAVPFWPLEAAWRAAGRGTTHGALASPEPAAAGVEAWAARLAAAGEGGAALVVLDAAQWADPWTLRALDALLSGAFGAPPLLWVAFRPREGTLELAVLLDEAERAAGRVRLDLGPLSEEATYAAVAAHAAEAEARALAAWLVTATGGLPDLMVVAAGGLAAEGMIQPGPGRWRVDLPRLEGRYGGGALPGPAHEVLRRRLEALDPVAREVVEVCAVAGGSLSPVLLESACGAAGADAVEDLMAMHLIVLADDEWGARYTLALPALGEAALAPLSRARRERLKARVEVP